MADNTPTEDPSPEDELAELKAKYANLLASSEADDQTDSEIKFNKVKEENRKLQRTIGDLTATVNDLKAEYSATEKDRLTASGNLADVIEVQKKEVETLQEQLTQAKLDVDRLMIGRRYKLPDQIAKIIPGSDPETIEANALAISESIPRPKGYSDVKGSLPTKQGRKINDYDQVLDGAF